MRDFKHKDQKEVPCLRTRAARTKGREMHYIEIKSSKFHIMTVNIWLLEKYFFIPLSHLKLLILWFKISWRWNICLLMRNEFGVISCGVWQTRPSVNFIFHLEVIHQSRCPETILQKIESKYFWWCSWLLRLVVGRLTYAGPVIRVVINPSDFPHLWFWQFSTLWTGL